MELEGYEQFKEETDGVEVFVKGIGKDTITVTEVQRYIKYIRDKEKIDNKSNILSKLYIKIDGKNVELDYDIKPRNFERIRRITGYLVGDLSKWNNAKLAEEKDRIKHNI